VRFCARLISALAGIALNNNEVRAVNYHSTLATASIFEQVSRNKDT